jgi:hypothetical protein
MANKFYLPAGIKDKEKIKFRLVRVRLNQGGYDRTGCYYGTGEPVYWAQSEEEFKFALGQPRSIEMDFRAANREDAKNKILSEIPNARFYN